MNLTYLKAAVIFISVSVLVNGCNKSDRDEDTETLSAQDYALAHHIFDDAFRQVHRFAMADTLLNDTNVKQDLDDCLHRPTTFLSDTVAVFPLTLQLNYADDGILCYDNGLRYGMIRCVFSGKYLNKGSVYSISFKGYKKDKYDVDGKLTIENKGTNTSGYRYYEVKLSGEHVGDFVQAHVHPAIEQSAYLSSRVRLGGSTRDPDKVGLRRLGPGYTYWCTAGSRPGLKSVPVDTLVLDE
ncbi:MAG: hypothetical protein WEC59_08490, partial [Salibacteraceae bacterium]